MPDQTIASTKQTIASTICFVGAGSIAEAVIRGLLSRETCAAGQISVINRSDVERLRRLRTEYGVHVGTTPQERDTLLKQADIVIMAMKPKDVEQALPLVGKQMHGGQLLVSVVAGVSISRLVSLIGFDLPVVRTMPNTSCAIGMGATGMSFSPSVTFEQRQLAIAIFESVGIVQIVDEDDLHMVTALSGSGPAYIYYVIEAMVEAAREGGLSQETAEKLAVQTAIGAAQMIPSTGESPASLRAKVTSPNGTTFAALRVLQEHDLKQTMKLAMESAASRSRELGST